MVKISVELDDNLYRRLRIKLAENGVKSAVVMRSAIEDYISEKWVPKLDAKEKGAKPKK